MGAIASLLFAEEGVKKNSESQKRGVAHEEISQWKTQEAIGIQCRHKSRKQQHKTGHEHCHSEGQAADASPIGLLGIFVRHIFDISDIRSLPIMPRGVGEVTLS